MSDVENSKSGRTRSAYVKPSAMFVELKPEERLMSCRKTPSENECDDPSGTAVNAS
ncbi:MAG: hypothetical protein GX446_06310 [Chthonomonadales bacterium]|nr:hypothetical protein [Chthonomonadales bacterium]